MTGWLNDGHLAKKSWDVSKERRANFFMLIKINKNQTILGFALIKSIRIFLMALFSSTL